jgi:hypothetical protein
MTYYNWTNLSLGTWSSRLGVGHKSDDLSVAETKEVKTRCNLAGSSNEGYCSERDILPVMMNSDRERERFAQQF